MFDRDIYYMPSVSSQPLRLTTTDGEQHVTNGVSDWTYEGTICFSLASDGLSKFCFEKDDGFSHYGLKQRRFS